MRVCVCVCVCVRVYACVCVFFFQQKSQTRFVTWSFVSDYLCVCACVRVFSTGVAQQICCELLCVFLFLTEVLNQTFLFNRSPRPDCRCEHMNTAPVGAVENT